MLTPYARLTAGLALSLLCVLVARAEDWPQWRGPQRDGVWRETGIVDSIPATGLKVRWRAKIAAGYSGPVVAKGRVFVTDHAVNPEVERVHCFEESTGKPLWVHSYSCDYEDMEYGCGPARASPTVHDGKVYTLGTKGHLFCLDAARGEVVWKKELIKDFNGRIPRYGASAAPLVVGDLLIVCPGGPTDTSVVAIDCNTGKERWRAIGDRPAYSAPVVVTAGGCRQLIVWTADTVASMEPATGKVFWQVPRKTTFDEAEVVASPVLHKDMLLCLAAWNRPSLMLKLDADKPAASVVWKSRGKPATMIANPLFQDDRHFFAMEGDGSLCCLDATSGKEVWTSREPTSQNSANMGGTAHLTPNGDRVFLFNQKGHLVLASLSPQGYRELGRCLLVEPTAGYRPQGRLTWAHPAYANKHVFARNDRELICASLAAAEYTAAPSAKPQVVKNRPLPGAGTQGSAALAISRDGKTAALTVGWGTVKVLDLATGKELPAPAKHKDSVCALAFSPDGKLLASVGGNEFKPARNNNMTTAEVKIWDLATKTERQLTGHTNKVYSAVFSPDGKQLATGSADMNARLWDVATAKEEAVLKSHTDTVWCVAFSPDGRFLASAGADRKVKLWDVKNGQPGGFLKGHEDEILSVAFSPDGKTLATGSADWTVRLWDIATEKQRAILRGHGGAVYCLAFSSDGKTLATGSGDETVKLWDVATATERLTLRGHRSGISALAYFPDNKTLASTGMDDTVRLWELTQDK